MALPITLLCALVTLDLKAIRNISYTDNVYNIEKHVADSLYIFVILLCIKAHTHYYIIDTVFGFICQEN